MMRPEVTEAPLLITHSDGLDLLTLNRPSRANALNREVLELIGNAVSHPSADAHAVVIRAIGSVFSGGVDLGDARAESGPSDGPPVQSLLDEVVSRIESSPLPIVALIQGSCVGGSLEVVLACDLRVATPSASFWIPATQIGVVYRAQGVINIARRLSSSSVRQLLLLGMKLDSSAARRAGVVDMVVDAPDPLARLDDTLARLTSHADTFAAQKTVLRLWSQQAPIAAEVAAEMTRIRSCHDERRLNGEAPPPAGSST